MAEARERSGLFKFFYIILRVLTFPIYAVLFVLRHPLIFGLVVVLAAGAVVYFPLSEGVEFANIPQWYKNRYTQTKLEVVSKAVERGQAGFIPEGLLNDAQEAQKKLAVDMEEAKRVKGENYNDKLVRDYDAEEKKNQLKKRRGFKKADSQKAEPLNEDEQEAAEVGDTELPLTEATEVGDIESPLAEAAEVDDDVVAGAVGLADILKKKNLEAKPADVEPVVGEAASASEGIVEAAIASEGIVEAASASDENKPAEQPEDFDMELVPVPVAKAAPQVAEQPSPKPQQRPQPLLEEATDDELDLF